MKKNLRIIIIILILILIIAPAVVIGHYYLRVEHFKAKPENGYHADFYLYVSPKARRIVKLGSTATLLIQPNNSGNSDDPEFHRNDAWWMGFGRHGIADDLGVVLLVPAFVRPSQDWHIYTHALDRDVFTTERNDLSRIDLQLLAMVKEARSALEREGIATNEKFLIQGYSASGMFANRFSALHPQSVMAVAAGSPGGWPIAPTSDYQGEPLPYPAGIADLEELTGSPFDSLNYHNMPQLIVMGALDENDSLDFTDGWEEDNAARVKRLFGPNPVARWDGSEEVYKQGGANAQFKLVEHIGHDRKALQYLTTEFFREILAAQVNISLNMPQLLKNTNLEIRIDLPLENYQLSRFDWTGKIVDLKYKGKYLSGTELLEDDKNTFFGKGFYNEFGINAPLGFDEIEIGDWFHKIGIGLLKKEEEEYNFNKAYEIQAAEFEVITNKHSIQMTCTSQNYNGYSYLLKKKITLLESGFEISYFLENNGKKTITTNEYNHNFLSIDGALIDSNYILEFPFQIKPALFGETVNPEQLVHIGPREMTFKGTPKKPFFFSNLSGGETVEAKWSLKNSKSKVVISETGNFRTNAINLWGCGHVISPELFFSIHLQPGESTAWTRRYKVSETD